MLTFVVTACNSAEEGGGGTEEGMRTFEVTARDDLSFDPASLEVSTGETVRFVVTNSGDAVHDFYVGTEEEQVAHEAEMGGMDHDADPTEDALTLDPGETADLTVAFDEAGEFLYGCHQPGHYDGGMVGTITVT